MEIKIRHYSPKTLKSYSQWARQYQGFTKSKYPELFSNTDVKEFLTFLAVRRKVSAATQNQAINALLFLFRHILEKEFYNFKDVVRAKRKLYIPAVLSRDEIDKIILHLSYPYDLIVKLLYGCGLRLFECLNLHIQNFFSILFASLQKSRKEIIDSLLESKTFILLKLILEILHVHKWIS